MNWIRVNWKVLSICVLLALWVTQCTKTCSRNGEIYVNNQTIDSLSSRNNYLQEELDSLINVVNLRDNEIRLMEQNRSDIKGVASASQQHLMDRINTLSLQVSSLKNENIQLRKDTAMLGKKLRNINK